MSLLTGLQRKHFRVIAADPPWLFKSNSRSRPGRNAMRHYECMTPDEIKSLPVADYATKNAALFLWITGPMLVIGAHIPIMKAWGFEPSGIGFVWVKLKPNASSGSGFFLRSDLAMGGGFTTRKCVEYCLIGKRGRSVRRNAGVHEVIIERRREHSRKPEGFYEAVRKYAAGPYLELFGRTKRTGWTVVGDESTKF